MRDVHEGRTDAELLSAAGTDPTAFGVFYDRHARSVLSFFLRRTACADTAADLTAETFAEALVHVGRFRPSRGEPRSWLFGIARNKLRRYARSGQVSRRALERLGVPDDVADHADRVVDAETAAKVAAIVADGLGRLRPGIATAVRLRVVEGRSYAHVAELLGCSEGAARVRVTRGLAQFYDDADLRARLDDAGATVSWGMT